MVRVQTETIWNKEKQLNEFLSNLQPQDVIDIKMVCDNEGNVGYLVIYRKILEVTSDK